MLSSPYQYSYGGRSDIQSLERWGDAVAGEVNSLEVTVVALSNDVDTLTTRIDAALAFMNFAEKLHPGITEAYARHVQVTMKFTDPKPTC